MWRSQMEVQEAVLHHSFIITLSLTGAEYMALCMPCGEGIDLDGRLSQGLGISIRDAVVVNVNKLWNHGFSQPRPLEAHLQPSEGRTDQSQLCAYTGDDSNLIYEDSDPCSAGASCKAVWVRSFRSPCSARNEVVSRRYAVTLVTEHRSVQVCKVRIRMI